MSHFIGTLTTKPVGTRGTDRLYELTEPFGLRSTLLDRTFLVPIGFVTDMASIPRAVQLVIQKDEGGILEAAIIHDWLYSKEGPPISRKDADRILLEGMTISGVGRVKRGLVYNAVRWFGGRSFKR